MKISEQVSIDEWIVRNYDAILKYAKEHDLKIGEEITLTAEGKEAVYMISGYTQISNYLGKDCVLTRGGFERLGKLQSVNYNITIFQK